MKDRVTWIAPTINCARNPSLSRVTLYCPSEGRKVIWMTHDIGPCVIRWGRLGSMRQQATRASETAIPKGA